MPIAPRHHAMFGVDSFDTRTEGLPVFETNRYESTGYRDERSPMNTPGTFAKIGFTSESESPGPQISRTI